MKKLIVSSLLLLAPTAFAHDGIHGPAAGFDKDGNGTLSLEEYTAYLQASKEDVSQAATRFKTLDSNADGKLSSGELLRPQTKKPAG